MHKREKLEYEQRWVLMSERMKAGTRPQELSTDLHHRQNTSWFVFTHAPDLVDARNVSLQSETDRPSDILAEGAISFQLHKL